MSGASTALVRSENKYILVRAERMRSAVSSKEQRKQYRDILHSGVKHLALLSLLAEGADAAFENHHLMGVSSDPPFQASNGLSERNTSSE